MIKKERLFWLGILLSGLIIYAVAFYPSVSQSASDDRTQYVELFNEALDFTRTYYVEEDKVTYKNLIYGAIRGMMDSLGDEHTSFLDPKDFGDLQEGIHGKFGGLGIYISRSEDDKLPLVVAPIEGTPAFRKGIKRGDKIIKIEDKPTNKMSLEQAISMLKGKPGTKVTFEVYREGDLDTHKFTIERAIINIPTVKSGMIKDGIGYIRVVQFSEDTADDFKKAVVELQDKKMKKLIIDLRNNPGGLFNSVVDLTSYFLEKGTVIVRTQGRNPYEDVSEISRTDELLVSYKVPIVILINKGSASASEIFSGAMKDTNRAVIMGEQSYGKGTVQNVITLSRGEEKIGLRITIQRYFTPGGHMIHKKGIEPDIAVKPKERTIDELYMERKLDKTHRIKNLIEKNAHPTEKDIQKIIKDVKAEGIIVDEYTVRKLIKEEKLLQSENIPLYDLEYDDVLKEAVDVLQQNHKLVKRPVKIIKR